MRCRAEQDGEAVTDDVADLSALELAFWPGVLLDPRTLPLCPNCRAWMLALGEHIREARVEERLRAGQGQTVDVVVEKKAAVDDDA